MSVIEANAISTVNKRKINATVAIAMISGLNKQGLINDKTFKKCQKHAEMIIDGKEDKRS